MKKKKKYIKPAVTTYQITLPHPEVYVLNEVPLGK